MTEFFEKGTPFKVKHPDNKFGKIWVAKIERSGYKMKLNFMKKVPLQKRSKMEQNQVVSAMFLRRTKFDQCWKYRKYKRLSVDMIKTKICLKTRNFRFHIRGFSPPQAAKMGFVSVLQKSPFYRGIQNTRSKIGTKKITERQASKQSTLLAKENTHQITQLLRSFFFFFFNM